MMEIVFILSLPYDHNKSVSIMSRFVQAVQVQRVELWQAFTVILPGNMEPFVLLSEQFIMLGWTSKPWNIAATNTAVFTWHMFLMQPFTSQSDSHIQIGNR